MSLNAKDLVFRWVNPENELGMCQGSCNIGTEPVFIPGNTLINSLEQKFYKNEFRNGISVGVRLTRATYQLRSSSRKIISVEKYLNPGKGVDGQYSGWLEFRSAKLKKNLLNCTQDHEGTFGQLRKLVYFPFVDCKNINHKMNYKRANITLPNHTQICHYPFDLKYCKAINNLNVNNPFPGRINQVKLNNISAFNASQQFITPQEGVVQYSGLGSLMPQPSTNNCEVDFVGDINIPVLILEIDNNHNTGIPLYILYDLVLEQIGVQAFKAAYEPFETLGGGNDQKIKDKYLKYKSKYLKIKKNQFDI